MGTANGISLGQLIACCEQPIDPVSS